MKTVIPVVKSLAEKGHKWPQFLTVVTAGFLALGAGLHFGWPSPSIPKLLRKDLQFEVTHTEISYITMLAPFGYLVGSPTGALLLDKIGRKKTLLCLSIPQITAWLLIATSTCVPMLYAARLIAGVGEGAIFTTLPIYLCEIAEPQIRGVLGTALTVGMIVGILFINCYGSYLPIRTTAYISISLPLLFLVTFMWMPESPYFFLIKGQTEAAKKSLKVLRRKDDVDEELTKLTADIQRQTSEPGAFRDLFTLRTNLKALFIVMGLRTLQQFSGISAFNVYTQLIFEQSGSHFTPAESSIIYGVAQVGITCFGSVLIDRFGRRPMVMTSTIGIVVFLFAEGLYFYFLQFEYDMSAFKWVPITGIMMYIIVYSVGLGVAPNLMMGELFSASIKGKALCVMNIYFAVCMSASFKLFQEFETIFGMYSPFFFFGGCCVVGIVFSYFCIPETKGKSLEEIQQILKTSGNPKKTNKDPEKVEDIITRC